MSGLLALRVVRGGLKDAVQELRALAFDNQTANFTAGLVVTGVGVKAVGTLTLTGNAGNTQTVTVGGKVYTFQTVLTNVDGNVFIGATASDSIDNLIAAINLAAGSGTLYAAATTANAQVSAAAGAGDTMTAQALAAGTAGNAIASTETLANGSWGAATLAGGIDASGATGTLVEQTDAGATGTLQLRNVVGEFTDNELITDSATGSALVNGTMTTPALTPDDSIVLQARADAIERHDAIQMLEAFEAKIIAMPWHADNGLLALRVGRGEQVADVERLGALAYDGQTQNFTVGDTITGGTSGATGTLVSQTDAGATGTLILGNIVGTFVNNDVLTDNHTGNGDANGAQTIPLLTPAADEFILQIDGVDMTKSDALECLRQLESYVLGMRWPAAA